MKKFSQKDVARMSAGEFVSAAAAPYRKLMAYLRPFKSRFLIGILCGAIYGGLNGLLVYTIKHVSSEVLPGEERAGLNATTYAELWHPERELPELREALAAAGKTPEEQAAAEASYTAFRSALYERTVSDPPEPPVPDPLTTLTLDPALPAEFSLVLDGERKMLLATEKDKNDKPTKAAEALLEDATDDLKAVLDLPEAERRHRSLWARYLLSHTIHDKKERSRAYDAMHEELDSGKFTDVLALAGNSPRPKSLLAIVLVCALIPGIMLLRAIFGYANSYCLTWVSLKVLDRIRGDLFSRILSQGMEFFNKQKSGDLLQTVLNQTRVAQQTLTSVSGDIVKEPLSIISALVVLFYIDWKFTLMSFILFPLCIIPVVVIGKKVRKAGAEEESEAGAMSVIMQEAFSGIRVVKAYGREDYESQRFDESNQKMLRSMMRWRQALEGVGPLVEVVASLGIAAALVYVHTLRLPASAFIALNGGLVMLYPPAKSLSRIPLMLQKCLAATSKVFELMERPVKVQDKPEAVAPAEHARGAVQFDEATFFYRHELPAVASVVLAVNPGETCALVGESGAGKSTLFSLLLRFYDVHAGAVRLDGVDVRDVPQEWLRRQIGIVSQDVFLFHDTIYENIRYGKLDATEAEIHEAARRAWAHDFIMAQESGYQTVVGDKGCNLSGGQQQRISIARAMLRNAPVLLLDEATSALDTESERRIQEALADLSKGKTVIAIAHRLSTVLTADKIVVMDKGRVAEIGRHDELLQQSAIYRRLYALQFNTEVDALPPATGNARDAMDLAEAEAEAEAARR